MENVIRDHLINFKSSFVIFTPRSQIIKSDQNRTDVHFHYVSGYLKWKYSKLNIRSSITEKIDKHSEGFVTTINDNYFAILTKKVTYVWDENGNLKTETLEDREVTYYDEDLIIKINWIFYIYNLKYHLEGGVERLIHYYPPLDRYRNDLEEIAEGNLDLIGPDGEVFFYVDGNNKVNVVLDFHPQYLGRNRLVEYIRDKPLKLKEEAEKLRIDFKKYKPKLFD